MKIRLLVLDFDGVMTDGRVLVGRAPPPSRTEGDLGPPYFGELAVFCSRRDGHGIQLLQDSGVWVWCITAEGHPGADLAAYRCAKLGIPLYSGVSSKGEKLQELLAETLVELEEVAYLGDDVGDLPALSIVGHPMITRDCHGSLLRLKGIRETTGPLVYQTHMPGGHGAVREVCDHILHLNGES